MKKFIALITISLLSATLCFGQQIGLMGVGGSVGFATISFTGGTTTESLSGFAIAAHADLGEISKGISLFPEIQYFSTSKDVSGVKWKLSDFAINANVHYNLEMEGAMKPYVGAGLGFNSISSEVEIPSVTAFGITIGGGTVSATDSRIGINLLAGLNYKINDKMMLMVEPRYVLASDFNHFLIKAGVTVGMN
jgi:opacity protein-like surface antigen